MQPVPALYSPVRRQALQGTPAGIEDPNRGLPMKGSHANRKATTGEMAYATQVIQEAYPEYEVV